MSTVATRKAMEVKFVAMAQDFESEHSKMCSIVAEEGKRNAIFGSKLGNEHRLGAVCRAHQQREDAEIDRTGGFVRNSVLQVHIELTFLTGVL